MYEFDAIYYFHNYSSLDIDYETLPETSTSCSKEKINNIVAKIQRCPNLSELVKEDSNKKGYHIRLYCKVPCDKCRLVFDDIIRFSADTTRKKPFTNIIFDTKKGY